MRSAAFAVAAVLSFSDAAAMYGGTCDSADTLLKGNLFDEAQKSYIAILKIDPSQPCARKGLEAIARRRADAERHRELARAYEGIDKQAAKLEALAAEELGIPQPKKDAPAAAKPKPFDKARRLAEAGLYEEARKKVADSIEKEDPAAFPEALRYLTGTRTYHFVRQHPEGVFLFVVFGGLALFWALRRIMNPQLKMDDLGDPSGVVVGRGAALLLQQQLLSLTRSQTSGIRFVTTPLTQVTVPAAISTAVPTTLDWIKPLLPLLSAFYWRPTLTLTGCVHPAIDGRGVGLTLVLSQDKVIVSTNTIWQNEYGTKPLSPRASAAPAAGAGQAPAAPSDPSAYFDLAQPAAIWLLFQLLQRKYKEAAIRNAMGTSEWKSYAMNAAGVRARSVSDRRAQDMLVRAVELDPANAAARANLGSLLHTSGSDTDERRLRRALEQLRYARPKMPSADGPADPVLYTASYSIAHTLYSLYALKNSRPELEEAVAEVANLVNVMKELRIRIDGDRGRTSGERERLRNFIASMLPTADVMRVGFEAELGSVTPAAAHQQLMLYKICPISDAQYNLACAYSVLARVAADESAERVCCLYDALNHLDFALTVEPALYESAESDASLATLRSQRAKDFAVCIEAAKKAVMVEEADSPDSDTAPKTPKPATVWNINVVTGRPLRNEGSTVWT